MPAKAVPVAVKVKALASVNEDGEWAVIGYPTGTDADLIEDARLLVGDGDVRHYWLEIELDLPNQ